jgi:hypothetical protein
MANGVTVKPNHEQQILDLFERLETELSTVLRARKISQSARQAADMLAWLRRQPPEKVLAMAFVGAAVLVGLGLIGLPKPPKAIVMRKRKADRRRRAGRRVRP